MKITCPHCQCEYPDIDDNLKEQSVECAECHQTFIAKSSTDIDKKNTQRVPRLEKSCIQGVLKFVGIAPLIIGVLTLFLGLIMSASNGADETTENMIPWIFSCIKWSVILSVSTFTISRIIDILEYACKMLYDINRNLKR